MADQAIRENLRAGGYTDEEIEAALEQIDEAVFPVERPHIPPSVKPVAELPFVVTSRALQVLTCFAVGYIAGWLIGRAVFA